MFSFFLFVRLFLCFFLVLFIRTFGLSSQPVMTITTMHHCRLVVTALRIPFIQLLFISSSTEKFLIMFNILNPFSSLSTIYKHSTLSHLLFISNFTVYPKHSPDFIFHFTICLSRCLYQRQPDTGSNMTMEHSVCSSCLLQDTGLTILTYR